MMCSSKDCESNRKLLDWDKLKGLITRRSSVNPLLGTPFFIVIGAQKAGTTAMYEYLSKHPDLKPSTIKELDFFSCDEIYHKGYEFYHSHFIVEKGAKKIFFEASPSYLHNINAPERIYKYNKNLKLIVILRNPVERAYSAWNMYVKNFSADRDWFHRWMMRCDTGYINTQVVRRRDESLNNFYFYLQDEVEALKNGLFIEAPVLSHGLYCNQLLRYLNFFDRNQLLILESGSLKNDTIITLRMIENFIGISSHQWEECNLQPVFSGEYQESIESSVVRFLEDYYSEANRNLADKFGIKFCMPDTE